MTRVDEEVNFQLYRNSQCFHLEIKKTDNFLFCLLFPLPPRSYGNLNFPALNICNYIDIQFFPDGFN
jgi:hypothetical protein